MIVGSDGRVLVLGSFWGKDGCLQVAWARCDSGVGVGQPEETHGTTQRPGEMGSEALLPSGRDVGTQEELKPSCTLSAPGKNTQNETKKTWPNPHQVPAASWCQLGPVLPGSPAALLSPSSPSSPAPFFTGLILFFPSRGLRVLAETRGPAACRWQQENRQTKQMGPAGVEERCLQRAIGITKE